MKIEPVEVVLTFANGRRHSVRAQVLDRKLANVLNDCGLAFEYWLEDHPDGPTPFVEVANG
jgi:hypothetical protein